MLVSSVQLADQHGVQARFTEILRPAPLTRFWWWTRPDSSRKWETVRAVRELECQRQGQNPAGPGIVPQVWAWERRREAGVPESVGFRTKPQLAQLMLKRALESGVPFGWVAGDEVGNDRKLRLWLEREGIPHVLAIRSNEKLWVLTDKGLCQVRADRLTSQVEASWVGPDECGLDGSTKYGLLGSRARATGCWPGAALPSRGVGLLRMLRPGRNGLGGTGEGGWDPVGHRGVFRGGQGAGGTGPVWVRRWDGWYRHITLAMLARRICQ